MKPFVSIIVPIYNVEKYLSRCMDSLISQTLRNIEIILVDDGSTDQSGKLADQFLEKDTRIKAIHKKNGGLSSARNAGLEIATGEYIGFVDPDDWVETDMFEKLYKAAAQFSAEVAISGGFCRVNENGDIKKVPSVLRRLSYEGEQVIDDILIPMIGSDSRAGNDVSIEMGVTLNIYQRELLENNQIRFVSERQFISEDILFNIDVLTSIKRASVVNTQMYYYRLNTQSLSQTYRGNRFDKECVLFEYLKNRLKEIGLLEKSDERLRRTFIGRARVCIVKEARDNKQLSVLKRIKSIKRITENHLLVGALKDYPISNYSLKLRLVAYCMKYRLIHILFLVSIFRKRG